MISLPPDVLARLGDVLHWFGCLLAGVFIVLAVAGVIFGNADRWAIATVATVVALLVFGLGRACRYVLAGR